MKPEYIDNFLDQEKFDELQTLMMGADGVFTWFYKSSKSIYSGYFDYENELDNYQFFHMFYFNVIPRSNFFKTLQPIFEKIEPVSLWRVKANLFTRTPNIMKHEFHVDMINLSEEKTKQWTTSIFYINTNNGYAEFEDGTKVESVANRMVTFPANLKHRGTSCTDEKTRVVVNFNYFK